MGEAAAALGLEAVLTVACAAYLLANLCYAGVPRAVVGHIIDLVGGTACVVPAARRALEGLFESALKLSEAFREETSATYFRIVGDQPAFESTRQRDVFRDDAEAERVLRTVGALSGLAVCSGA